MIISLIAAASENNVIGVKGDLPWKLPDDMKFFKNTTTGHPVVMGRKTFESFGGALKNRKNIVITRNKDYTAEGAVVVHSKEEALQEAIKDAPTDEEIFIIGGAEIYNQFLHRSDRIYLTRVHTTIDNGDAFFPQVDREKWKLEKQETHPADERHAFAFTFMWLVRR